MKSRALLLSLILTSCAVSIVPTKPYVPQAIGHAEDREVVVDRIVRLAARRGWEVLSIDSLRGSITTVATSFRLGVEERQTWVFVVSETTIRVSRFEALRHPGEGWTSTDGVCLSYSYAEEKQVLDEVLTTDVMH